MGEFKKIERLGSGYFGEVWLEYDQALGVKRAVKYVAPGRLTSQKEVFREAQLLSKIVHENVIRVHEAGQLEDRTLYIVMDYCRRGSVESRYHGRALPLKKMRKVLTDILRGLEFAHAKKIIHRDIKPANILCKTSMDYLLSDFGLAARIGSSDTQSTFGYVSHFAPEVIVSGKFTIMSDIYASGVTAYRLANGDSMLPRLGSVNQLKRSIARGLYPHRTSYRVYVPRKLRAVINRALEVNPGKRYRSALEFRHAVEQVNICCSWTEKAETDGTTWVAEQYGRRTEVRTAHSAGGDFTLSVFDGPMNRLHEIRRFRTKSRRRSDILRSVAKVTQSMVSGKTLASIDI